MEKFSLVWTKVVCFGFMLLKIELTNGAVNIPTTGTPYIGNSFKLECLITPFTGIANWNKDGTTLTNCGTSFCAPATLGNYTFSYDGTGISVTIDPVSTSDGGSWSCTHTSEIDSITLTPTVQSTGGGGAGIGGGIIIGIVIALFIVINVIIIIVCCLYNKRCMSRYLRKDSKFLFNWPKKEKFLYFAYGCNLLKKRIHSINPNAVNIGNARLKDWKLDFVSLKDPRKSSWLGGVAALERAQDSYVWGTLWELNVEDRISLQRQHELYILTEQQVMMENMTHVVCETLMLTENKVKLGWVHTPSHHYKAILINGALESGLPRDYIQELLLIPVNNLPEQFEEEADI